MRNRNRIFKLLLVSFAFSQSSAQVNTITAGFQFKPIFPVSYFNTGPQTETLHDTTVTWKLNSGFCAGMMIRRGFSDRISLETGINYVKRNYTIEIKDQSFSGTSNYSIIGYEIPVSVLIFVPLAEKFFMDVSMGASLDMYPSSVATEAGYYKHVSDRRNVFSPGILANLGYEYRTEKAGIFYLGASYHRPFKYIYQSYVQYKNARVVSTELSGNYLTFDIRYFFHEDPLNKKKRKPAVDE